MADSAPPFVHLHNHSTYSLLDGAQRIDEMCVRAAEDGQPAIAITDHGNLFGVMEFGKRAAQRSIRPIVGIEAYVAPESRLVKQPQKVPGVGTRNYYHLILLAENYVGYKNLIKLSTAGYLDGFYYRPRIDKELLREHGEGLICLSACLASEVATFLKNDQYELARKTAGEYLDLFGEGRYWLEIQDHGIPDQTLVNEGTARLSHELGIGLVATNDCHYLKPEDHFAHDVLICIQTGNTVNTKQGMSYTPEHYLKSRAEMAQRFAWAPEAIENTVAVAERCKFAFEPQPLHLPEFPVPDGYDLDGYFEKVARDGFEQRMAELRVEQEAGRLRHPLDEYRQRLDREIKIIRQMGYSGYFLVTWDFIRYAREQSIPVGPGRGSAAGSLVAFSMKITDLDPLQYDLLFERFLNPERVSMPDIDIDFCYRRRERVIDYVTHKYGRENVAQIITFGTMAARAVIRDVGRGLEIPYAEVDRIAKLVPAQPGVEITIEKALNDVPALRESYEGDVKVKELIDVAQRLEGLTRHASTHAAGVVIAPRPIVEYAPLYRGTKEDDEITTQWAKDEIEEVGLLKLDFLGLKTLTLIDDALKSIAGATGERPDIDNLSLDDPKVYELFCKAATSGIFQFESDGMQDILRRMRPERFEDLVALNALYRPGPIGGGLIDEFIKRRHGRVKVRYPHRLLEEILRETYGVIVYQEQVMQIASVMAGYSLGEADILRRAMGKKKIEVMEAEEKRFIERSEARGIKRGQAKKVFELMAYFAGYGFNKSHSAAYALVAYQTAWLKAHHPVHFMAALLTTEKSTSDKLVRYINDCREAGIEVLPPDVNASGLDFTVENDSIRFGLSAIKNVGESAIRSTLAARELKGRFSTLDEFCAEIDLRLVNKRVLESLIQSGALDSLGARRSQLSAIIDSALEYGQKQRANREAGQGNLFGSDSGSAASEPASSLPNLPEWDDRTLLANEKATLGFYVSGHPLQDYSELLQEFATHTSGVLGSLESGTEVALGGVVTGLKRRKSRKGEMWASLQLDDLEGQTDVMVFPKSYAEFHDLLDNDRPLMVLGRLKVEEEKAQLIADDLCLLDNLRHRQVEAMRLMIDAKALDDDLVMRLYRIAESHRGDARLLFEIVREGAYTLTLRAGSSIAVKPSTELTHELEEVLGPGRIRYKTRALKLKPRSTSRFERNSGRVLG